MDNLRDIVSKNIIYLRTNNKMTQLQLGEALSYSDKAVSKWERGEAIPDAYVLKKLSTLFSVSVDFLLSEHDEKDIKAVLPRKVNRRIVSLISFLGIWTIAYITFVVLLLSSDTLEWLVFVYALPVSLVVMVVLTAVWGKPRNNFYFISLVIWSILAAVYFTFLQYNWWILFIIGFPAQLIVFLSFRIKQKA